MEHLSNILFYEGRLWNNDSILYTYNELSHKPYMKSDGKDIRHHLLKIWFRSATISGISIKLLPFGDKIIR